MAALRHYGFQAPDSYPIDVVIPVGVRRQSTGFVVGIRSGPEGDLLILLRRGRLPMPRFNARLYDEKTLIAVADAWWPDAGVAAEVDSREYHYSAEDWQQTMRRHDRLVARGVLVLHFTPARIRAEPQAVAAEIRSALIAGRSRPRLPIRSLPPVA